MQTECFNDAYNTDRAMAVSAPTGSGKCFARGTRLRLVNGDTIAVEDIVGGERLLGDDGLPRIVTPGSLTHDAATLYRIAPTWDGASPFTVNGAHILVLVNNTEPCKQRRSDGAWEVLQWEVSSDNRMRECIHSFCAKDLAQAHLDSIFAAGWQPVEWEPTVQEFLSSSMEAQHRCQLVACKAVTFTNPMLPSLWQTLTQLLGGAPSTAQLEYMAWWLGIWLAVGVDSRASVCLREVAPPVPRKHQRVSDRLLVFERLFLERIHETSNAGSPVRYFIYPLCGLADLVLRAYGLINNKHLPRALICDALCVRQQVMAGLIDGNSYHESHSAYELQAKDWRVISGYKELAATLGLRNGAISAHTDNINQQTGKPYAGHRITISGDMCDVTRYCAAPCEHCPQPCAGGHVEKIETSRCYGLAITEQPAGEYFGFIVNGGINRRFLLEDYTVTHNVSPTKRTVSPHPPPQA